MAWVLDRSRGQHWVQFRRAGKQYTVRLGKVPRDLANRFAELLDRLIATADVGVNPDPEIRAWLERMADGPRQTITTAGLAPKRGPRTLGELLDRFTDATRDRVASGEAKPSTLVNVEIVVGNLREYFRDDCPLAQIDNDEAAEFRRWIRTHGRVASKQPLAETTVSRRCRRAREIFEVAVDRGWLARNPWKSLRGYRETNPKRDVYVPRDVVESAIAATGDLELRLLLALARYGGIRIPSEVRRLELNDINVETRTVRIRPPKTERLDYHDERLFPLWPEIEPHARAVFDRAPIGQVLAVPNLQSISGAAITSRAVRAVVDGGASPWPKFFVNLRASCEHDLFRRHPIDDVCTWLGHSPAVALKHYRRTAKVVAVDRATNPTGVLPAPDPAAFAPENAVSNREGP